MDWLPTALVVLLALGFTYTNGFHDSANAIATSVSTRALTPRAAVGLAAIANLIGAFFGARVAETVGHGIIAAPQGTSGLVLCVAALVGAIAWNLLTWWRGLPSSSSHALIGGLCGAALAAGSDVLWDGVVRLVIVPMLASPILGAVLAYAVMAAILWIFRRGSAERVTRGFRLAQTVSAAGMALGHGMQDAAKTAGVIVLALTVSGHHREGAPMPVWVLVASALVLSLGTYAGGWRIICTLGQRIIDIESPQGFAAEVSAAAILYVATVLRAPISSTHAITAAILGAGSTRGLKAVRWRIAADIGWAWLLTLPGAAGLAAAAYGVLHLLA